MSLDAGQTGGSWETTGSLREEARKGTEINITALLLLPDHLEFLFQRHSAYLWASRSTLTSTTWFARLALRERKKGK